VKALGAALEQHSEQETPGLARRRDFEFHRLLGEAARNPAVQGRIRAAMKRGFQTRDAEMDLARMLTDLGDH